MNSKKPLRKSQPKFHLQKPLVSHVLKTQQTEAFRYYIVARDLSAQRAGYFTLDHLMDQLHSLGWFSLHHRPGNARQRMAAHLADLFSSSDLFIKTKTAWKVRSWRHFAGRRRTAVDQVKVDIHSGRAFRDALIGCSSAGTHSVKDLVAMTGFSRRRVQLATARNHAAGTWQKVKRLSIVTSGTKRKIRKLASDLFKHHGLLTHVFNRKREAHLCVYLANFYGNADTQRDSTRRLTVEGVVQAQVHQRGFRFYCFKNEQDGFQNYLDRHGFACV